MSVALVYIYIHMELLKRKVYTSSLQVADSVIPRRNWVGKDKLLGRPSVVTSGVGQPTQPT